MTFEGQTRKLIDKFRIKLQYWWGRGEFCCTLRAQNMPTTSGQPHGTRAPGYLLEYEDRIEPRTGPTSVVSFLQTDPAETQPKRIKLLKILEMITSKSANCDR